jgi:hypothetical protein
LLNNLSSALEEQRNKVIKKNGKPHDNVPLMEWGYLSLWYMASVVVNGFGRGRKVRYGGGEPLEQTSS